MRTSLVGGRVLTPDGFEPDLSVTVESERIVAVGGPPEGEIVDLQGSLLVPGFVDLQVNGGGDVLLNDSPDATTMARIADAHLRFGTTSLLPTLISDRLDKAASAIAALNKTEIPGVIGLHVEGPFLSPERKGVHDVAMLRPMDEEALALISSLRRGRMILTVAPEVVPPGTISRLTAAGVIVCAGHSAATYEQVRGALDAGLAGFTHLFNGMSPLESRAPGMVGAALEDRQAWCGVIVDNHHVHPAALKVALAAKPKGSIILVTDAMPPVGGVLDSFVLGGERITCRDGRCANDQTLAGSCLDMATAVRNTVRHLGVDLAEACRMASLYPARALGLDHQLGQVAPGWRADLVALNDRLEVERAWRGGEARVQGSESEEG
jgi:N-acetylglucosamine-6-phosphate deacetylase